ncbi:MAG: rhodanese-like domain-containing protein [Caldilineaceae bacterium]|nr:rhodanese-like domain-containing protein [Caldilineaceae bacterium]
MKLWQRVRTLLGAEKSAPLPPPHLSMQDAMHNDEPEIVVPEITVEELQAALAQPEPPLVLDVREPHEWRLVRLVAARHLPMNDVPAQLDTLPRDRAVVVMCAHGSRSYDVAAWLIEQGIEASSLAGGVTEWARRGGPVAQGAVE